MDEDRDQFTPFGTRVHAVVGGCEHMEHPAENVTTVCGAATEQGERLCPWHIGAASANTV